MTDSWHQTRLDHRAKQSEVIASAALSLLLERGASALTMAAIASAAGISRQTLYRYYPDVDAVLVGIAESVASHDGSFEAHVRQHASPATQLDVIVGAVARAGGHHDGRAAALRATLPPQAREVLARHEERTVQLLETVLRAGIDIGVFRADLEPSTDAALILGLAAAADPHNPQRAIDLVHRMVDQTEQEIPT